MREVVGDVWDAWRSDPDAWLLHGVTQNLPAAGGFAGTVVRQFGREAEIAHYGVQPGDVCVVAHQVFAGVTQRRYGHAEPILIMRCVAAAVAKARSAGASQLVMPLIGAGLGGLTEDAALAAIRSGSAAADEAGFPVEVYRLPEDP